MSRLPPTKGSPEPAKPPKSEPRTREEEKLDKKLKEKLEKLKKEDPNIYPLF